MPTTAGPVLNTFTKSARAKIVAALILSPMRRRSEGCGNLEVRQVIDLFTMRRAN